MDRNTFAWWLHGWSEINGGAVPTTGQWKIVTDHLSLAMGDRTPSPHRGFAVGGTGGFSKEQADLIHAQSSLTVTYWDGHRVVPLSGNAALCGMSGC